MWPRRMKPKFFQAGGKRLALARGSPAVSSCSFQLRYEEHIPNRMVATTEELVKNASERLRPYIRHVSPDEELES